MPIFRYNEQPGNYYAYLIESSGDDLNDGLTPETAVATLDRLVEILDTYAGASSRHAVIVKKRIYNEGITYSRNSAKPITFEFVGGCEIDGSGVSKVQFGVNGDYVLSAYFIDYSGTAGIFTASFQRAYNSKFTDCTVTSRQNVSEDYFYAFDSIFINSMLSIASASTHAYNFSANRCILINVEAQNNLSASAPYWNMILKNCIISNCGSLMFPGGSLVMDYCNVVDFFSTYDQDDLIAAGYNLNGISANPQFTDPTNGQYTVNQSSPCLYRGEGGEHIGIGEGFYLQANILYFQQSVINNFQLTTGRLGFIDPLDNAFIETNPIDIGQIITLESAELAAILPEVAGEFTAGPVSYSHWYPAYSAASTYHKGAGVTDSAILYRSLVDDNLNNTPASSATEWERLTWESGVAYDAGKIVQYTDDKWYKANTATSTSWVAGEWDEVVMIREWNLQVKTGRTYAEADAADWATIPYNTTPYLDLAGKGNYDDAYNPATGAIMVFRFIAVRIDAKTIV